MNILSSLKFVKNGYARKDLVPNLTHYLIQNGRVTAYNGSLAFSSPINLDLDIAPQAMHFHKCIEACSEEISLTLDKGKLKIKSGNFKSTVKCIPTNDIPTIVPMGVKFSMPLDFVEQISKIISIIDNDSGKPYTQGVNFRNCSAFVTNNIIMVELWIGQELPEITIPKKAIVEVCKYGKPLDHILVSNDMIFFIYDDGRWLGSKIALVECPDFHRVLDRQASPKALPQGFWGAIETLSRFADDAGKVTIATGEILAGEIASDSEPIASVKVENLELDEQCLFNINQFLKIKEILITIEFKAGQACLFHGDKIRGAIVGYRK